MRRILICIIVAVVNLAADCQWTAAGDLKTAELCASKNLVECALNKYLEVLARENLSKQRQIDFIMRRYPGHDPSVNIGMWTANTHAADEIRAYIDRDLSEEIAAAKEGIRAWTVAKDCIKPPQYEALWYESNLLDHAIATQDFDFDSLESEKDAIMKRYPGFDASQNIGRWAANVEDSDRLQSKLDQSLKSVKESALPLLTIVTEQPKRC